MGMAPKREWQHPHGPWRAALPRAAAAPWLQPVHACQQSWETPVGQAGRPCSAASWCARVRGWTALLWPWELPVLLLLLLDAHWKQAAVASMLAAPGEEAWAGAQLCRLQALGNESACQAAPKPVR